MYKKKYNYSSKKRKRRSTFFLSSIQLYTINRDRKIEDKLFYPNCLTCKILPIVGIELSTVERILIY